MAEQSSGLGEAVDVGTSAASHLHAMKTAAHLSKTVAGAAAGPFTAAISAAIANRHTLLKAGAVILGFLLLPVLFILMLPGLIFGSLTENTGALNSNALINENIQNARQAIVEVLEESHADLLEEINTAIAALPEGSTVQIVDPYETTIAVNAHLLISQFCASQDDYENINIDKLQSLIRENKDGLFSYDVAEETVSVEVETEAAEGETPQTETVTFTRYTYTVSFAGDAYFADHVFYLSEEQKELAENYASNLTLFFGAASGTAMAINLSDEVLAYRPLVSEIAARYGMSDYGVSWHLAPADNKVLRNNMDVSTAGYYLRHNRIHYGSTEPALTAKVRSSGNLPQKSSLCSRADHSDAVHHNMPYMLHIQNQEDPSFSLQILLVNSYLLFAPLQYQDQNTLHLTISYFHSSGIVSFFFS